MQPEGESRLAVADNGWIYVMAHYKDGTDTQVKIFRSVDGGATYQQLKHWYPEGGYQYADFDIVVTGKNASDIRVWSVELLVKDSDSKVVIFRRDADMANSARIYDETLPNVELYDVAMASNYKLLLLQEPVEILLPWELLYADIIKLPLPSIAFWTIYSLWMGVLLLRSRACTHKMGRDKSKM